MVVGVVVDTVGIGDTPPTVVVAKPGETGWTVVTVNLGDLMPVKPLIAAECGLPVEQAAMPKTRKARTEADRHLTSFES